MMGGGLPSVQMAPSFSAMGVSSGFIGASGGPGLIILISFMLGHRII